MLIVKVCSIINSVEEPKDNLHFLYMGDYSAVHFMYKSRVFNAESVNKLENLRSEKAKIHKQYKTN